MSDVTLKPCPFCGSPAELEHDSDHHGEWFNLGCSRHWHKPGIDPDNACIAGRLGIGPEAQRRKRAALRLANALAAAEPKGDKGR